MTSAFCGSHQAGRNESSARRSSRRPKRECTAGQAASLAGSWPGPPAAPGPPRRASALGLFRPALPGRAARRWPQRWPSAGAGAPPHGAPPPPRAPWRSRHGMGRQGARGMACQAAREAHDSPMSKPGWAGRPAEVIHVHWLQRWQASARDAGLAGRRQAAPALSHSWPAGAPARAASAASSFFRMWLSTDCRSEARDTYAFVCFHSDHHQVATL